MFPGQGAQRVGMGRGLFDAFPSLVQQAEEVLGYDIAALCLEGPADRLVQTRHTQPALFVVGALAWLARPGPPPAFVLGHSVGEYAALFAAGVLTFEDGLRLIAARAALMEQAPAGGGMAAVLGLDRDRVEAVLHKHAPGHVFVSNINAPLQIVISGRKEAIARLEQPFMAAGASMFRPLEVSGAFHTPFMQAAQDAFAAVAAPVAFAPPTIPVLSNVTAALHEAGRIRDAMVAQITAPVRWSDSIRALLAEGIAVDGFEEVGATPPGVLKPMIARIQRESQPLPPAPRLAAPALPPPPARRSATTAALGSRAFCEAFGVRRAYVAGGMYQGIASTDIVIRMARSGLLAFFGTGGLRLPAIAAAIAKIRQAVPEGSPFGINVLSHTNHPHLEDELIDLLLQEGVTIIEAAAFMQVTPALVRYRARGLAKDAGRVVARHRIVAKVSRPDVAQQFLLPAPEPILARLLAAGAITASEAELARAAPVADAICVEADSGGHTDQGVSLVLLPAMLRLRDQAVQHTPLFGPVHVGAAGGIGTPEAALAMFVMGADFILTGSINQCTVEAATSDVVKDLLQGMNVHDTDYAPSGELFELGSRVQVLKKGIFFPARANKLLQLYGRHASLDAIDDETRRLIETRYFKRSFEAVFEGVRAAYPGPETDRAERDPRQRMALVFRTYFRDATRWALAGDLDHKVDFQVQCGPALGAFNQWVAGTGLAEWRHRHVDTIGDEIMEAGAALLTTRLSQMVAS